jgi:hypothetical protein
MNTRDLLAGTATARLASASSPARLSSVEIGSTKLHPNSYKTTKGEGISRKFKTESTNNKRFHRRHYITPPENSNTSEQPGWYSKALRQQKSRQQLRKKDLLLQISSKVIRLQTLQDPTNSILWRARQEQRAQAELGSRNNYVLLATTWQKTTNSDTLFSSKEGRSTSKTDINSTAGQLRPGEAHRD